jgi:hypothetical protein
MEITHDYFCSTLSQEGHEPLYGSAPEKRVWLLLEYNPPWGAQAFPESALPDLVKAHLSAGLTAIPDSNILMLRQPGRRREGIAFFIVIAEEQAPRLHEFSLNTYTNILDIDLAAVVKDDPAYNVNRSTESLYLVCTNARRDRCCAKFGIGIYNTLQPIVGKQVWQCSHIGGHRFAPTGLFLPHGICYGRMEVGTIPALVEAYRSGHLALEYLRGRVCYPAPVQAADYLLRRRLEITAIDAVQLIHCETISPDLWDVQFAVNGETHRIRLEKYATDTEIFTSCNDTKTAVIADYHLI